MEKEYKVRCGHMQYHNINGFYIEILYENEEIENKNIPFNVTSIL